jgi:hypothetical protein
MTHRGRHHVPTGRRDYPIAASCRVGMAIAAVLGLAAGTGALVSINGQLPPNASRDVTVVGSTAGGPATQGGAYLSTVTQSGRLVAIADTSVTVAGDDGITTTYTVTPETTAVPAYGFAIRSLAEQFAPNEAVIVVATVDGGVATATSVIDQGMPYPARSPMPLMLV